MGATASEKRARIEAGLKRREDKIKSDKETDRDEPHPMLYMHDDNTAMIAVVKTRRNPTMRSLGRVHGVSIDTMHEATLRKDFLLGPIGTKSMCADVHTKAYPENRAAEWFHVRQNCGVFSPAELNERCGVGGPGWQNYQDEPGKIPPTLVRTGVRTPTR